ncbi:MAG: flagellar FlbD family protein [Victivallales bacterium]|nr:flagellar FlbD family protein [Victivallales bacterium]
MIKVTDVGGKEKYINCELIEKIELIPDTLLVLVNGHNFIVSESPDEVIRKIIEFKRQCHMYRSTDKIIIEEVVERKQGNQDAAVTE